MATAISARHWDLARRKTMSLIDGTIAHFPFFAFGLGWVVPYA